MSDASAFAAFVAPWRQAVPALALAEAFASAGDRDALLARVVLLFECCDAVWRVSEAQVGLAKLGWWAEEWSLIRSGRSLHPLAAALRVQSATAPLLRLGQELETATVADAYARWLAYEAIADEFARGFYAEDSLPFAGFRHLAELLVISRHRFALRQGRSLAVLALPRDWRARLQLPGDAEALAGAPAVAAIKDADFRLAEYASERLGQAAAALPALTWSGQRGARVLAALALRELENPGSNWVLARIGDLIRAWRVARETVA